MHALVVVDVQHDFCEGGALAAADTSSLLVPLASLIAEARRRSIQVVFTQDWHPPDHSSFRTNGGPWPIHCVAETAGAELVPLLRPEPSDIVIKKGTAPQLPGYSAFEETELQARLRSLAIESVAVCGIATEYCVRATALDAIVGGLDTAILVDLTRAVEPSASAAIFDELREAGAHVETSSAWLRSLSIAKSPARRQGG